MTRSRTRRAASCACTRRGSLGSSAAPCSHHASRCLVRPPLWVLGTAVFATILRAASACAGPTGLNVIPTTDLVPFHQVNAVLQNGNTAIDGRGSVWDQPQPVPQVEIGLPWDFEGGLDAAPSDPPDAYRPIFNLKRTMLTEGYYWPAVAIGALQLGPDFTPAGFLVASKTLNYDDIQYQKFRAHHRNIKLRGIRAHLGFMQVGELSRALIGTDIEVSDHFVIYADWMSGATNALSLGGVVVFNRTNSLILALLKENDQNRVSGVLASFTHTFDW